MDLIFLDTETTGFKDPRVIELAFKKGSEEIRTIRVKPPIEIEAQASEVHGITMEDLIDLPSFLEHPEYMDIKKMLENGIVVAHNASYDVGVMAREGIRIQTSICTQKVSKKLYAHAPNHRLQGLRDYLKLDTEGEAHSAGGDVAVLFALYDLMKTDMETLGTDPDDVLRQMMLASLH